MIPRMNRSKKEPRALPFLLERDCVRRFSDSRASVCKATRTYSRQLIYRLLRIDTYVVLSQLIGVSGCFQKLKGDQGWISID